MGSGGGMGAGEPPADRADRAAGEPGLRGRRERRAARGAALRNDGTAKDDAPPPSRQVPPPSGANPFQGVRFGPPPEGSAAPRAARRAPEPPRPAEAKDTRASDPQRTSTGTALSRVVLALPPPQQIKPNAGENLNPVKTLRVRYDAWRKTQPASFR